MLARTTRSIAALAVAVTLVTTVGGQSTMLVGTGAPFGGAQSAISGDGRYVAFQSSTTNLVLGDLNGVDDVFVYNVTTGSTIRVSVDSAGSEANAGSRNPAMSTDGRFVAFASDASNLVVGDTNHIVDVFVHDSQTGSTVRASVDSTGIEGNGVSGVEGLTISGNGRFVVFASDASNLVPGDVNAQNHTDIFVHDLQTGQTTCASVNPAGLPGQGEEPSVSANGRFVAFESGQNNLVPGDSNNFLDVFVRDRTSGTTERVSVDSSGNESDGQSRMASISADGRYVAFLSFATNLIPGGTNGYQHVFVHDRQTGSTTQVSVDSSGVQGTANSFYPAISANGRFIAFESNASNLVAGDTNGWDDIFVHSLQFGITTRVSVWNSGQQFGGYSDQGEISADGRFVTFNSVGGTWLRDWWQACYLDSDLDGFGAGPIIGVGQNCGVGTASNGLDCDDSNPAIHPGAPELCNGVDDDCNGAIDDGLTFTTYYADSDGDGYGDASTNTSECAQPSGYVTDATDCNDADAAVHPGASDVCNGVDDDCDGVIDNNLTSTYCTAGTTVHGCVPAISGVGAPSSNAGSGFDIVVQHVEGNRMGLIFYGFYPTAVQWAPGSASFRCIAYPTQRTPISNSGGTLGQCTGALSVDFNAWIQANPLALGYPFVAGQVFYAQGWFRDSGAPKGTNLSDGLRFTLCN